jgi:hypothetical protein
MLESTRWRIAILGNHGFSAKLIRKMCKKYDGEDFSPSTIYKALKLEGIRLREYRDGKSGYAVARLAAVGASKPGFSKRSKKKRRKKAA